MRKVRTQKVVKNVVLWLAIGISLILLLFPYFWTLLSSLKPLEEMAEQTIIPRHFTLSNYKIFFTSEGTYAGKAFRNSAVVASFVTFISILLAFVTAYAALRFRIPGRRKIVGAILGAQFMPLASIIIPFYLLFHRIKLLDTWWCLISVYLVYCLPFAIWLFIGFIQQIPREMEEAAMVDGCSRIMAIFKIVVPLTKSGIFTTATFVFIKAWQEYLGAEMLTSSMKARTVPVVLVGMKGQTYFPIGAMMAGVISFGLPILIFFCLFHSYFLKGTIGGALKH